MTRKLLAFFIRKNLNNTLRNLNTGVFTKDQALGALFVLINLAAEMHDLDQHKNLLDVAAAIRNETR